MNSLCLIGMGKIVKETKKASKHLGLENVGHFSGCALYRKMVALFHNDLDVKIEGDVG